MTDEPIITAYWAGAAYAAEAARLAASLHRLGVPAEIEELHDMGGWLANTHLRPQFLSGLRTLHRGRALLSLDVDCIVHADPRPHVMGLPCDVGVHFLRETEPLAGTLLVMPTEAAGRFLQEWRHVNQFRPDRPDRVNFRSALEGTEGLRVARLPAEVCWIFDISAAVYGDGWVTPIVEHLQASREYSPQPSHADARRRRKKRIAVIESTNYADSTDGREGEKRL